MPTTQAIFLDKQGFFHLKSEHLSQWAASVLDTRVGESVSGVN